MTRLVPITDTDPETLGRTIGAHLLRRTPEERKRFFETLCATMPPVKMTEDEIAVALRYHDRKRITELETALRPFALYARQMGPEWCNNQSVYYGLKRWGAYQVKYADYGTAFEAMKGRL